MSQATPDAGAWLAIFQIELIVRIQKNGLAAGLASQAGPLALRSVGPRYRMVTNGFTPPETIVQSNR